MEPDKKPTIDEHTQLKHEPTDTPGHPRVVLKPRQAKRRPLVAAGLIALAAGAGFGGAAVQDIVSGGASGVTILSSSAQDGNTVVTPDEESISAVAKAVSPSVVSVLTSTSQTSRFFDEQYEQQGAGTGMIVSSDGYIMTNKHVIDGADSVTVVLTDGKRYEDVEVLGSDPLNDVAFLRIKDVTGLPAITFGDSKTLRIGQSVVAIGNALGQYQNSVTSGIISGTGRPVIASSDGTTTGEAESLTDLIQTDAAINSGNSGGPLLNLKGQVIGINTAIAADAQSIGFAIPIGATKGLLAHVIKTGKVERAYLGVQYISITSAVKEEYDLAVSRGDYITSERGSSVQAGGPADKAGIKDKDIIVAVNGSNVGEVASVSSLISEYEPGDTVDLTVLRDGKEIKLTAKLGTYQD
ncbi:trypsin-like peptidase domain-containing protein [Candidatus Saccharibacteria bacterium]|nr:trypsin-like peptidase domain-containing protein [Candidatus Saccharibacteria bacterium]